MPKREKLQKTTLNSRRKARRGARAHRHGAFVKKTIRATPSTDVLERIDFLACLVSNNKI